VKRILVAALIAALGVAALAPSLASASRRATAHERKAISWVMGRPPRCDVVRISTAARGWALLSSRNPRSARDRRLCRGHLANGYVVLRRRYGQWRNLYSNSGTDMSPCRVIRPVPAKVGVDFGICAG
jgi:hypothetical protein